ncbi:MAG: cobalamin biosynthesis protein [Eubacteriales bacterium]|nr:cobalamin biosynthesis protein [Eubacteriales bacterium]
MERLDDSIGIKDWAAQESSDGRALIFIGALGICVRAISGITADKLRSVPVINIDETGHFVIPVLSGHVGGANELAVKIAEAIGAVPVVTTATDLNNAFAADMFAMENGLGIVNREGIAAVSSRSLDGKPVRLQIEDFPDILSENNETSGAAEKNVEGDIPDIIISSRHELFGKGRLNLCPRKYAVGIGCRKGKGVNELREFLEDELRKAGIDIAEVGAIASIDLKKDEPGLIALSRQLKVPFITFTAEMLKKAVGEFAESAFVEKEAGVGNVCERAAMLLTGNTGLLPVRKTARDGMTLAVAENRSSGSGN